MNPGNAQRDEHPALLLVDIQRDFVEPGCHKIASPGKAYCLQGASRLLSHARKKGWRVIHVGTRHESRDTLPINVKQRGYDPFCVPGTRGIEFHFDCGKNEPVYFKQQFSAFSVPELRDQLRDIRRLVLAGVSVDCCVLKTAFDASELGFECLVGLQAVSATRLEDYISAIRILAKSACSVMDLDSLGDADLNAALIQAPDVEERARTWYLANKGT